MKNLNCFLQFFMSENVKNHHFRLCLHFFIDHQHPSGPNHQHSTFSRRTTIPTVIKVFPFLKKKDLTVFRLFIIIIIIIIIIKVFPFLNGKTLLYFVCLLFFFFRRFSKLIGDKSTQDIKMIFGIKYRVNKSYLVLRAP